jgi:ankyrin repeat protein
MTKWNLLALMFLSSNPYLVAASDLFGEGPSAKEREAFGYSIAQANQTVKAVREMQFLLEYQAFSKGQCDGYLAQEAKAKAGDAPSAYLLSLLYRHGFCVPKNDSSAFKWATAAAEAGHEPAFFEAGAYLSSGIGTAVDNKAAVHWYELASKTDNRAFAQLAGIFLNGEGVPQNFAKALDYANSGASSGDPLSQQLFAMFLVDEAFGPPNLQAAYGWALLAKSNGDATVAKGANELIARLDAQLTPKQIRAAQNVALNWKPKPIGQLFDPENFSLPKLELTIDLGITEEHARLQLKKLGLPADRMVFFRAIKENNLNIVRLYFAAGASVSTYSPYHQALPIHHAARHGSKDVLEYLIVKGADVNAKRNADGDTAILFALSEGHLAIVELLLSQGARVDHPGIVSNAVQFDDPALLERLRAAGADLDVEHVGTPLKRAVAGWSGNDLTKTYCREKSAKYLLTHGANANAKTDYDTILTAAIRAQNPTACVRLLLEHGADANGMSGARQSPMFHASLVANSETVSLLLEHGANAEESFQLTPNEIPLSVDNEDARNALMNDGSLLLFAVAEGNASIAKLLRKRGANHKRASKTGETPLSLATKRNDSMMVAVLTKVD